MNNELTDNEVNKIIAEFMGLKNIDLKKDPNRAIKEFIGRCDYLLYTESLDSLIPVWEKLNAMALSYELIQVPSDNWIMNVKKYKREADAFRGWIQSDSKSTLQQAAAHATAIAILELSEVNNAKL